jgi:hypothetical protein
MLNLLVTVCLLLLFCYFYLTDEKKWSSQRPSDLPGAWQLRSEGAGIQTQIWSEH